MKIKRREYGQDLIEYAIIFPLLFLILVGIFDLGRVVYYYSSLTNAAREGARWGIIHPDDTSNISAIICNYSVGLDLGCPNPPLTIDWIDRDGNSLAMNSDNLSKVRDIRIKVTYQFKPVTPLIASLLNLGQGDTLTLNGQARMRVEQ
jgi:hypothetical protein